MNIDINWFWFCLPIGSILLLALIEEILNRKGYEPDLTATYWIIGSFFIFAFI